MSYTSSFSYTTPSYGSAYSWPQIVGGYNQRKSDVMGTLAGYGDQQLADINAGYQASEQTALSRMAARGLSGSTLIPTLRMGYQKSRAAALGNARDQIARTKADAMSGLSADELAAMERANQTQYAAGMDAANFGLRAMDLGQRMSGVQYIGPQGGGNSGGGWSSGSYYDPTPGYQMGSSFYIPRGAWS